MRLKRLAYIKTVRSKGRTYYYFDTGTTDARGKPVYNRLPDKADHRFGSVYAAMLGHRTRRALDILTVPKLVEMYQASTQFQSLAPATQKLYRIYQGRFAEQLPSAPANGIERKDMVALFDKMADTPGAANMLLASVAALYRWGRRGEHVSNRPCDDIDPNEIGEHEPWPEALLAAGLKSEDRIIRLSVHVLYYTAQRISDAVLMTWSKVGAEEVEVVQVKTGKELNIPLHPDLASALPSRGADTDRVLMDDNGKPFSTARLRGIIQRWAAGKGHKIVPHGLRKNAVNSLLECGCTVAETAAVSGQSMLIVEHYAKKRNQAKLARRAMSKWRGTDEEQGNQLENRCE
ncbi:MAG: tyrosine-type recombinase/integrase [Sphingobium sp.]